MRRELELALELARRLPTDALPQFLGEVEEVRQTAVLRLYSPAPLQAADRLVDVAEAACRLNISKSYLYRHSGQFPFARHIGRKLVFSSLGIDAYITARR